METTSNNDVQNTGAGGDFGAHHVQNVESPLRGDLNSTLNMLRYLANNNNSHNNQLKNSAQMFSSPSNTFDRRINDFTKEFSRAAYAGPNN